MVWLQGDEMESDTEARFELRARAKVDVVFGLMAAIPMLVCLVETLR
jgi:hypothetical protein